MKLKGRLGCSAELVDVVEQLVSCVILVLDGEQLVVDEMVVEVIVVLFVAA